MTSIPSTSTPTVLLPVPPNQEEALRRLKAQTRRRRRENPETAIVRACQALLKLRGLRVWRQNSGWIKNQFGQLVKMAPEGAADLSGILANGHGTRLEIEVKVPGNQPTPTQWAFLREIQACGGVALVVHSAAELDYELRKLKENG